MKDYDSFAPFYDLAMGDREDVAVILRKLLRRYHPKAKSLVEFGCGSGSLLRVLTKYYQCTGVDLSAGMIKGSKRVVVFHTNERLTEKLHRCAVNLTDGTPVHHIPPS